MPPYNYIQVFYSAKRNAGEHLEQRPSKLTITTPPRLMPALQPAKGDPQRSKLSIHSKLTLNLQVRPKDAAVPCLEPLQEVLAKRVALRSTSSIMPETPPEEDTEGESEVDDTAEIPLPPPRLPKARGVVGTIASMGTHYEKKKVKLEF